MHTFSCVIALVLTSFAQAATAQKVVPIRVVKITSVVDQPQPQDLKLVSVVYQRCARIAGQKGHDACMARELKKIGRVDFVLVR